MKSSLKYSLKMRCKTMAVLAVYLCITVSFIFFLSGTISFSSQGTQPGKSKVENIHSHSVVEREAKATFKGNEKSPVHQLSAVILNFQVRIKEVLNTTSSINRSYTLFFASHRYSYLSFLSLRI